MTSYLYHRRKCAALLQMLMNAQLHPAVKLPLVETLPVRFRALASKDMPAMDSTAKVLNKVMATVTKYD